MKHKEKTNQLIWGIILISIGILSLGSQFIEWDISNLGILILPLLGLAFLTWGILTRQSGLMIPGGILSGIGLGTFLISGPFAAIEGDTSGGIFMLSFAFGWFLITILTALFGDETHWWPLIPGGIMALIGLGLLFGTIFWSILETLGLIWPLILIGLGVYILYQANRNRIAKS